MQPLCQTFATFVHARRRALKIPLRAFCQQHGFDAGLISKIEQGIYPARAMNEEHLTQYAIALQVDRGQVARNFEDWETFWTLAAESEPLYPNGPSDEELVRWLPAIVAPGLRIDKLREDIRKELTYAD